MSSTNVINVARPILSQNRLEARRRAIRLYKYWYRTADFIYLYFRNVSVPLQTKDIRQKVREEFEKNRHHTDLRVIDLLLFKSQNDLREVTDLFSQQDHLMGKWWNETTAPKSNSFLEKFLTDSKLGSGSKARMSDFSESLQLMNDAS